jgi:DNA topoisomerase-3
VKGESGPHTPTLTEKQTTPPPYYNEASLLRAMETAGKFVEDEELRAAMKENGIGRPSSRAGIIETLFKRHYIRREKKRLVATPTGIELIDMIKEELLKSCELTGIWEKKLRDIEHRKYDPAQFVNELKEQITAIVNQVLADNSNRRVTLMEDDLSKGKGNAKTAPANTEEKKPKKRTTKKSTKKGDDKKNLVPQSDDSLIGTVCPLCGKGHLIKGKTAYGCSEWKNGCTYRLPFTESAKQGETQ